MRLGYARVSTDEQTLTSQCQRLSATGCEKLFEEKISGSARNRPKLEKLLEQLRKGDVLVVTRLDRLARSTSELLRIAERITEKNAGLQSLDEPWADTTSPSGRMVMTICRHRGVRAHPHPQPHTGRPAGRSGARRSLWQAKENATRPAGTRPRPRPRREIHQRRRQDLQRPPSHDLSRPGRIAALCCFSVPLSRTGRIRSVCEHKRE